MSALTTATSALIRIFDKDYYAGLCDIDHAPNLSLSATKAFSIIEIYRMWDTLTAIEMRHWLS